MPTNGSGARRVDGGHLTGGVPLRHIAMEPRAERENSLALQMSAWGVSHGIHRPEVWRT